MKSNDPAISHEEVRSRFSYDLTTGILSYRVPPPNQSASLIGKEAGYLRQTKYGIYRVVKFGKIAVYAHRLIWFYMLARWPEGLIDHKDGDTLNNRFFNLRPATQSKNKSNCLKYRSNTSGFKGVTKCKGKWKAQITFQSRIYYLGLYATPEEAHAAYLAKAKELQGVFSNPG